MGGKEARGGFWFQDAKALTRLMADAIERRRRRLLGIELEGELRVRVESAVEVVVDPSEPTNRDPAGLPIWDGTFTTGNIIVVDECKLGGPSRNDRVTFYRRLRATIASGVPAAALIPRFTVGRDSIDVELWSELRTESQSIAVPVEPPLRVASGRKAAEEALYYLTTPVPVWKLKKKDEGTTSDADETVPVTPALPLDEARALLGRVEVDATTTLDELDAEVRTQLGVLGGSLAIDELVDLLGGWIGRVARATTWHADLTADSLTENLTFVARYLTVPPAIEHLWHRLRTATPPAPVSLIAEQAWRDVQPHTEQVVRDRANAQRVAFTSEGGVGKSHLLATLFAESTATRVWVDAVADLRDLEDAIALGAWAAARAPGDFTVFVDAIDQISDPAALLATIDRALALHDRAVVYVAMRFATWADARVQLSKWRDVRLVRWTHDRIRALAESGRTDPLSTDLVDLLRTPLLLDLFLRTFSAGDAVPPGLATRHGVLRAYFERRIYPDAGAPARREVLDAGVAAVLQNTPSWRSTHKAAQDLLSEGVVVSAFGAFRFRHALLRDFSAALELVSRTATQIASSLRAVDSPIVRNELLRGTIEAMLDPDPIGEGTNVADLVRECTNAGLAPGIALGTTDAPTAPLLAAIAPLDNGGVMRQALAHAHLIENRAWLHVPSTMEDRRPDWLAEAQYQGLASLSELALASGDVAGETLAAKLRAWTLGGPVGANESWSTAMIGALLVRALPDDDTAEWFARLPLGATGFRSRFLEQLRDLGASPQPSDAALSNALHNVVFGEGSHVLDGGNSHWEVTNLCLSDHDGMVGLLNTRPYVASLLLFALSVEVQIQEDRRHAQIVPPASFVELFGNVDRPADFVEAEERLRIRPALADAEAIGNLVDDAPTSDYVSHDYVSSLIEEVAQRAHDDRQFAEHLADAALASRSVHARIIVLSLQHAGHVVQTIDHILRDPRVYHMLYASGALWDALQRRWPDLSADDRALIQRNILNRARSPFLSFTSVGRLASAIPRGDLTADLQPYIEFLEATGRSTTPYRSARVEVFSGAPGDDFDEDEAADPANLRLEELSRLDNDAQATNEAIDLIQQQVATLGDNTSDRTWFAISRLVQQDERRKSDQRVLGEASARTLFERTLGAIASRRPDADRWATMLDIADACPSYVPDVEALAMRKRVIEEVVIGAGNQAERENHAWRALVAVRDAAWFVDGTGGREVFRRWFRDHLRGDGLQAGQRRLQFFSGDERVELVRHLLETPGRLSDAQGQAFADSAGRMLASWSLWWPPEFAREYVRRLFETNRTGALALPEAWRRFLSGFGWSLQNDIRHVENDPRVLPGVARFMPLLELAWSAWRSVVDDVAEGHIAVGWSVTAPLGHEFETKIDTPVGGWSTVLRPLLPRVVLEGGRNDIAALQQVAWASVDPETLMMIVNATITRADLEITRRPATDWMLDSLIETLARVGTQPMLTLVGARRVLDCLQRLGRSSPRAINAALLVERDVRVREGVREV